MVKEMYYDTENDIFMIHKGFSKNEKFQGNFDIGNLILDISNKGRIRGLEVLNATSFFKEFNLSKTMLQNITSAELQTVTKPDSIMLSILFKAKNCKEKIPAKIAVPLTA